MNVSIQLKKVGKIIPKTNFVLSEFMAMSTGEKPAVVTTLKNMGEEKLIKDNFPGLFMAINHGACIRREQFVLFL